MNTWLTLVSPWEMGKKAPYQGRVGTPEVRAKVKGRKSAGLGSQAPWWKALGENFWIIYLLSARYFVSFHRLGKENMGPPEQIGAVMEISQATHYKTAAKHPLFSLPPQKAAAEMRYQDLSETFFLSHPPCQGPAHTTVAKHLQIVI